MIDTNSIQVIKREFFALLQKDVRSRLFKPQYSCIPHYYIIELDITVAMVCVGEIGRAASGGNFYG